MGELLARLDRKRKGTHYSDRMHRILGVCQQCGLLYHMERVAYRNGAGEMQRVEDIEPEGSVLITPQYEKYGLRVNPRVLPRLKMMAPQFAYALNVPQVSVDVEGNIVYVRVPRPHSEARGPVHFGQAWDAAPNIPRGSLLLGIDEEQHQLVVDLSAPTNVHAAVIGMTGSGKSSLMRTMILSAQLIGGAQVALFDPSDGFRPLSGHPAVWRGGLFQRAEDCERGLAILARSIGKRSDGLLYVFVDEVPELITQQPRIREHLARLAQAGRHAGMHLVLGAQHPLASELGPTTLRNVPVRLVGRVADRTAAYNATGRSDSGAENLRGGGDFLVVSGSLVQHFQAALVPDALLQDRAKRFPPREPRLPVRASTLSVTAREREPSADEGAPGLAGRRPDDISPRVIHEIQRYIREQGDAPSSNWVYRLTRELMPTGGYNRAKAQRAISAAQEMLDGWKATEPSAE